jgi:TonB-dependent receptor
LDAGWAGSEQAPGFAPSWATYKGHIDTVGSNLTEAVDFGSFQRGDARVPAKIWSAKLDLSKDRSLFVGSGIPVETWVPIGQNSGARAGESDLFLPNEIRDVIEKKDSIYGKLNFGNEELDMPISGNIGARYVKINIETPGFIKFPREDKTVSFEGAVIGNPRYTKLPENDQRFLNDDTLRVENSNEYTGVLPSFNLKLGLTEELIARFAASKAISLPPMGYYNNYTEFSSSIVTNPQSPARITDITSASAFYSGRGGNPNLKPMESVQEDVSLEWYFAEAGSLTGTVFYKDLKNYFISETNPEQFTSPSGGTRTVGITRPQNGDKAKVQGFEIAYQQFYDFLPAPLDGLGVQANYTLVETKGIKNSGLKADDPRGLGATINFDNLPLEGLSEDTANLTLMYQKHGFEGRFAYNYRSDYLVTASDAVEQLPIFNKAGGNMDASFSYALSDNFKVGLQVTNLLDEQTETYTYIQTLAGGNGSTPTAGGAAVPVKQQIESDRSWFINDRRYALFVRGTF